MDVFGTSVYINKSDEGETMKMCWNFTHSLIVSGMCDFFAVLDNSF